MCARAVTRLAACAMPIVAAALLAVLTTGGSAATSATRIVDRTLQCTTGAHAGARVLYPRAQSAFGEGKALEWLAQASVSTEGQPLPFKPNYRPTLAGVTAGWPPPPPLASGGIAFHTTRCAVARGRVALSPRGLAGGVVSQFGDEYRCVVSKTLLVRIRAVFRAPVDLDRQQGSYAANGRVQRGQIAVSTLAGKPLVYAEVTESGTSRLFTSKGCS